MTHEPTDEIDTGELKIETPYQVMLDEMNAGEMEASALLENAIEQTYQQWRNQQRVEGEQ